MAYKTCKRKRKANWTQEQLFLLAQLVNAFKAFKKVLSLVLEVIKTPNLPSIILSFLNSNSVLYSTLVNVS